MGVKLIHKTEKRVRYYCPFLNSKINEYALLNYLKSIKDIDKVRVNRGAKSIVFESKELNLSTLEDILNSIDIEKFKFNAIDVDKVKNCSIDKNPSKARIYRVLGALALKSSIENESAKFAISSIASAPLLIEGFKELFSNGINSRVLESMAVGVSLARGDYLAADGTNLMLEVGEYIEESISNRSDDLIKELAKPNVEKAWVEVNIDGKRELKEVDSGNIDIGDIVVVGVGETIAVDGHIISGEAFVNQVSMTGEAKAIRKVRGDRVISGTVIEDGRIKIWAESVKEDRATERIKSYILSSLQEKSEIGLKATKLADSLVPITLSLATVAYLINRDFKSIASVLQADYSCALKLATPVAFKSSIAKAGKDSILVKGAKSIEMLSEVDTFVFDKTGTLTYGELEVVSVESFDKNWSRDDILNLTASAEEHYFHPVAEAVVKAAKERGFIHMHHDEVDFIVAHGVKTTVDNKSVVIGSRHFLEDDEKIDFSKHRAKIQKCLLDGKTILYVGYDGELLGTIGMRDRVRKNAKVTIDRLRESGIKNIVMLTGDIKSKANELAKELNIDRVYSDMKPTDKANILKELKSEGLKIAFVGDGINDAPALMSADVGISMSKGADIAKATADISLLKDDISSIVDIRVSSIKTIDRVKSNFNITIGTNSAILLGATAGLLSPLATAILHNGTTIGLLLNSMREIK